MKRDVHNGVSGSSSEYLIYKPSRSCEHYLGSIITRSLFIFLCFCLFALQALFSTWNYCCCRSTTSPVKSIKKLLNAFPAGTVPVRRLHYLSDTYVQLPNGVLPSYLFTFESHRVLLLPKVRRIRSHVEITNYESYV